MDQALLPQVTSAMVEGEKQTPLKKAIIWEVQRQAALPIATAITFQTRERGDYWRVAIMDSAPVAGNIPRALIGQGVSVWNTSAVQLGGGGSISIPVAESSITILNIGDTPLDIVVIMIGGFTDEYVVGESLA